MKIGKILRAVLILEAIYIGYLGTNKASNNSKEVEVLGLEIDGIQ